VQPRVEVDRLGAHGVREQPIRLVAEQHLARLSQLLDVRGHAYCGARDIQVLPGRRDHNDLARVDGDADREPQVPLGLGHLGQLGDGVSRADGRARGAQGVVLVQLRRAEDRHHRVADELLHRAAVRLDRAPYRVEVTRHQRAVGLGVELAREPRRLDQVAEENRDRPA
jgi:hypothetical protein